MIDKILGQSLFLFVILEVLADDGDAFAAFVDV
jgi:hypothetical protein